MTRVGKWWVANATSLWLLSPVALAGEEVMSRKEFEARVGVACITPELLPAAFQSLPIGYYKDFHALGKSRQGEYLPVIQYRSVGDTPEIRNLLRAAADSGHFPIPAGLTSIDELLALLELSGLESWLVEGTRSGAIPQGTLFLLGNEPGYRSNHDPRTPEQIVEDARLVREIFQRHGLQHRLALGGMSTSNNRFTRQAYGTTPAQHFEGILEGAAERKVIFDAFVLHPYPVSGLESPDSVRRLQDPKALAQDSMQQVREFRATLNRFGQRNKDVIVGEVGLPFALGPTTEKIACGFAEEFLPWCLTATDPDLGHPGDAHRLVQRFTWFLLAVPQKDVPILDDNPMLTHEGTVLLDANGKITELGKTLNRIADRVAPKG